MLALLDPRQRQQIVDQARHPGGLGGHGPQEALARLGIVARRPGQRIDEAAQRGQRRAQLVAGIGDEVLAHALDHQLLGELAQADQGGRLAAQADRHDQHAERARRRTRQLERELRLAMTFERLVDRRQQPRIAQARLDRPLDRRLTEQRRRRLVGADHLALAADQQQGVRQRVEQGREQAVGLGAALALLGERAVEAMQRGRELVAAERPELGQRRRLAALGQRLEIAPGHLQPALAQPGERAAQREPEQPGEHRRLPAEIAEQHEAEQDQARRQRQPDGARQQPDRLHQPPLRPAVAAAGSGAWAAGDKGRSSENADARITVSARIRSAILVSPARSASYGRISFGNDQSPLLTGKFTGISADFPPLTPEPTIILDANSIA